MGPDRVERRLAAILAADVAGYSRLMGADEEGTHAALMVLRREVSDPKFAQHRGRIVKTTGDGFLAEFASVVDAVRCAVELQREMALRNSDVPSERRVQFRIGINIGDIIIEADDIYGDGVNVAARLETLAEPGGICISATVHEQVQGRLDCTFTDFGEQSLKNIARPIRVYGVEPKTAPKDRAGIVRAALVLPDKPSIAVLPFQNLSGDPEQEYFADGMVEEIITALSRIRWLFVIARNSTFTYKGQAIDVNRVGRELGVRYVLEGSVRKGGGRVRITAQLIEAQTGAHLWADRFDGSLEDVFDLQDQVASSVAGVIEPALQAAETARSAHRSTRDLSAYDLYLRALAMSPTPQTFQLLEEAIARDPYFGPALALAASCSMNLVSDGAAPDRDANRQKGIEFARRALAVAGSDPGVLADAAFALACFGEDIVAMTALVDRALTFNPNFARGWHASSFLRLWAGQTDLAIEHAGMALRLSPRAQASNNSWAIGAALFFSRRFEEAIPRLCVAVEERPIFATPYRILAACYAHMGLLAEAQATVARLRTLTSEVIPTYPIPFRDPMHRELYYTGLRLALGEEAVAGGAASLGSEPSRLSL
ncbi:MAG: adenylate/guanylate cyclase domain-containing protein [Alphaproteobacteria bacterium]|nr:adenylate/guanylate cyclase domain-containing protein [Alphaproteobacteria bacterium]